MLARLNMANSIQRYTFCVDTENTLKYYKFNESWEQVSLGSLSEQKLHPESKICACFTREGMIVYFQDASSNLRGIEEKKGVWKSLEPIVVSTQEGTPLKVSFSEVDSTIFLYYIGADKFLHYRTIKASGEDSQGRMPIMSKSSIIR